MTRLVGLGLVFVVAIEVFAVVGHLRSLTLVLSGVVVAVILYGLRRSLSADEQPARDSDDHSPEEVLRRWLARTEMLIRWADRSRGDWDRHLRPLLAREFQAMTSQQRAKNRAAADATGRMMFGDDLWQWVDPFAVSYADRNQPAPGRAALDAILQRLLRL
jgi:hypothetical protein